MSGAPSLGGAEQVVDLVDRLRRLDREIADLVPKAERLKEAQAEREAAGREFGKLLTTMDVAQEGNYGWPMRTAALVAMVIDETRRR